MLIPKPVPREYPKEQRPLQCGMFISVLRYPEVSHAEVLPIALGHPHRPEWTERTKLLAAHCALSFLSAPSASAGRSLYLSFGTSLPRNRIPIVSKFALVWGCSRDIALVSHG
jgi:hypothetical protein